MKFTHKLVQDWKIRETHWCREHNRVESSAAWANRGLISVIVATREESDCVLTKKRA